MRKRKHAGAIYLIRHVASGRCYVGQTVNLANRWYEHRSLLRRAAHHSPYLQNAWNKYGAEAFCFEVLEHVELRYEIVDEEMRLARHQPLLNEREQYWMKVYSPIGRDMPDFNVAPVAGSRLGVPQSPETRQKISIAWDKTWRGNPAAFAKRESARLAVLQSEESRARRSERAKATGSHERLNTPEARAKRAEVAQGSIPTHLHVPEVRERIAVANRRYWDGLTPEQRNERARHLHETPISKETRQKMSDAKRGKVSPKRKDPSKCGNGLHAWIEGQRECRECASAAQSARYREQHGPPKPASERMTAEVRQRISESLKGRVLGPLSDETKAKIGEKNAAHWAAKRPDNYAEIVRERNNAKAARYRERKRAKAEAAANA